MEGTHKVYVKFSGKDVPKSPFEVKVEGVAGNAEKVTASGPGKILYSLYCWFTRYL